MKIGDRIREIRKEKGLTQQNLAVASDISRVTLGFYERNENTPPADVLGKLAAALGVDVNYLLYGDVTTQSVTVHDTRTGETYKNDILIRFPKGHALYVPTLQEMEEQKEELLEHFNSLNPAGKDKTVEYAKDLAVNPLYQSKKRE